MKISLVLVLATTLTLEIKGGVVRSSCRCAITCYPGEIKTVEKCNNGWHKCCRLPRRINTHHRNGVNNQGGNANYGGMKYGYDDSNSNRGGGHGYDGIHDRHIYSGKNTANGYSRDHRNGGRAGRYNKSGRNVGYGDGDGVYNYGYGSPGYEYRGTSGKNGDVESNGNYRYVVANYKRLLPHENDGRGVGFGDGRDHENGVVGANGNSYSYGSTGYKYHNNGVYNNKGNEGGGYSYGNGPTGLEYLRRGGSMNDRSGDYIRDAGNGGGAIGNNYDHGTVGYEYHGTGEGKGGDHNNGIEASGHSYGYDPTGHEYHNIGGNNNKGYEGGGYSYGNVPAGNEYIRNGVSKNDRSRHYIRDAGNVGGAVGYNYGHHTVGYEHHGTSEVRDVGTGGHSYGYGTGDGKGSGNAGATAEYHYSYDPRGNSGGYVEAGGFSKGYDSAGHSNVVNVGGNSNVKSGNKYSNGYGPIDYSNNGGVRNNANYGHSPVDYGNNGGVINKENYGNGRNIYDQTLDSTAVNNYGKVGGSGASGYTIGDGHSCSCKSKCEHDEWEVIPGCEKGSQKCCKFENYTEGSGVSYEKSNKTDDKSKTTYEKSKENSPEKNNEKQEIFKR